MIFPWPFLIMEGITALLTMKGAFRHVDHFFTAILVFHCYLIVIYILCEHL